MVLITCFPKLSWSGFNLLKSRPLLRRSSLLDSFTVIQGCSKNNFKNIFCFKIGVGWWIKINYDIFHGTLIIWRKFRQCHELFMTASLRKHSPDTLEQPSVHQGGENVCHWGDCPNQKQISKSWSWRQQLQVKNASQEDQLQCRKIICNQLLTKYSDSWSLFSSQTFSLWQT